MANKYAAAGISDADARQALAIRSGLEKRAGKIPNTALASLGGVRNMFLAGLALGAGAQVSGIAGAGVAGTVGKASEMKMNASSGKRYSAMLKADPSLRSAPKARTYFNVLQKASPFIASEPHVAAATIRSMLESPEGYALHPKVLKDIMEIEGKRQDTRYPGLRVPTFRGELPDMT